MSEKIVALEPQDPKKKNSPVLSLRLPEPNEEEKPIVCYWNSKAFSVGAEICVRGAAPFPTRHRCMGNGTWFDFGDRC